MQHVQGLIHHTWGEYRFERLSILMLDRRFLMQFKILQLQHITKIPRCTSAPSRKLQYYTEIAILQLECIASQDFCTPIPLHGNSELDAI